MWICMAGLLAAGCAAQFSGLPADVPTHTLTIRWQRLVDVKGKTCPRCGGTEQEVQKAYAHLKRSLAPVGVQVQLEAERIEEAAFREAPLESNRIWIDGRALEEWLGAQVGSSACCDACEGAECRTVSVNGSTYEAIPARLIVRAGILAASDALRQCGPSPATWELFPAANGP